MSSVWFWSEFGKWKSNTPNLDPFIVLKISKYNLKNHILKKNKK